MNLTVKLAAARVNHTAAASRTRVVQTLKKTAPAVDETPATTPTPEPEPEVAVDPARVLIESVWASVNLLEHEVDTDLVEADILFPVPA